MFIPFNCRFSVIPNCSLDLPLEVKVREEDVLKGGDGLLPLGCRCSCHSPWSVFKSLVIVATTSREVGMSEISC